MFADINKIVSNIPGAEKVLKALGILEESDAEKRAALEEEIQEAEERIAKFDVGENAYRGFDTQAKRDADAAAILELQKELNALKGESQQEKQKASTLKVDPALQEALKKQQSNTNIVDSSTKIDASKSSNHTVVLGNITDPIPKKQGLVNG